MNVADSLSVASAGVDTWKPVWRIDSRRLDDQLVSLFNVAGAGGARMLKDPSPSGHRLGFYPSVGLMFAEGHPAGDGQLAQGDSLGYRLADLEIELSQLGLHMGGTKFDGMGRIDATADLRFAEKSAGVIAMAVLASVQYPRLKVQTIRAVGDSRVETVLLKGRSGRKTVGRMYDKGVQTDSFDPGEWMRFEDQRRWGGVDRPDIHRMTASCVREQFHKRFVPLYQAEKAKGVTVAGPAVVDMQLAAMYERGEITYAQLERISGQLHAGQLVEPPRATKYRRRRELREFGLYSGGVDQDELIASEVDIGAILEAALDAEGWGVG